MCNTPSNRAHCKCSMSHVWMSHVIHIIESHHTCAVLHPIADTAYELSNTYEWVMPYTCMSLAMYMNESCHACAALCRTISTTNEVSHTDECVTLYSVYGSRHTCATPRRVAHTAHEWVKSWTRMSHVMRMNESYHAYKRVMSHI